MNEREARYARFRSDHDQLDAALADAEARDDDEAALDAFYEATQSGMFKLCPAPCPQDGCEVDALNLGAPLPYRYTRIRYGDEGGDLQGIAEQAAAGEPCPCCQVTPGRWHHVGCLFERCPYCGSSLMIECHGDHRADIARERTPPELVERFRRPGFLAYLASLRTQPGMDAATVDMVIALAGVFAPAAPLMEPGDDTDDGGREQ